MTFDKPTEKSPFLTFTAAEFRRRGTQQRRELTDKTQVHQLLKGTRLGGAQIGLPERHAVLTSPEELTSELLGDRVAVKFAHGWSAKGVMLLERTGEDRYFDHMGLREWTLEGIRERQHAVASRFPKKEPVWIVEELIRGAQPGAVPFDYKFYTFQGQIAMVAQIDRNSSPPRVVKLDGDLKPLVEGRDYRLKAKDLQPGVPVVPRSAVMLSRWAVELSKMTDSPFVRVDLYDGHQGPYFGEFTFSSGAEYKRTITYSTQLLDTFDQMFLDAEKRLAGESVEAPESWSTLLQSTDSAALTSFPSISLAEYERYAYFLHNQGSLGAHRLAQAQERLVDSGADAEINNYLVEAHKAAGRRVRAQNKPAPLALRHAARKAYKQLRRR